VATSKKVKIDVLDACGCCYRDIGWKAFLRQFVDRLPRAGQGSLLRIKQGKTASVGLLVRSCGNGH
jgi:hypothetical protein